jgi:HSP20 family protein
MRAVVLAPVLRSASSLARGPFIDVYVTPTTARRVPARSDKERIMATETIAPKKADSVIDEIERIHEDISKRAYELFRTHEDAFAAPIADWLQAERELVWRPPVEVRQRDSEIELTAAVAGVEPKDLDVQVAPEDILITGSSEHRHERSEGTVHVCEFEGGRLFRSIHLPARIDPASAKAEYQNGLLRLRARLASPEPARVDVRVS